MSAVAQSNLGMLMLELGHKARAAAAVLASASAASKEAALRGAAQALDKRRAEGLTTPKQIRFLEQRGFQHVGTWGFDDASKMISRISANGWRTPSTVDPAIYDPKAAR